MLMALYDELFGVQQDNIHFPAQARESLVYLVTLNLATLQYRNGPFTTERNDILFACWNFMLGPRYGSVTGIYASADESIATLKAYSRFLFLSCL